jgi:hypothetical protein
MPHNFIFLIFEIIAVFLVFQTLVSILKTVFSTVILICVLVLVMTFFGFSPQDLFPRLMNLPQTIRELFTHLKGMMGF